MKVGQQYLMPSGRVAVVRKVSGDVWCTLTYAGATGEEKKNGSMAYSYSNLQRCQYLGMEKEKQNEL